MAWFKVDDGFWAHPKTFMLSDAAIALWLKAGTWAAQMLTDGRVPSAAVSIFRSSEAAVQELVESGLWLLDQDGYRFHDWDEYQPSAEVEKSKRAARAEAARKAACARWHGESCGGQCESHAEAHGRPHAEADASKDASTHASAMPRPVPSRPSSKEDRGASRKSPELPLPESWEPSVAHEQYAREHRLDLSHEAHQFRAHALANDRRQRNWNGAFSQWLGNAKKWGRTVAEPERKVRRFNDELD